LAVAIATNSTDFDSAAFLRPLRSSLTRFSDLLQDTSPFTAALDEIERGLSRGASCAEVSKVLGNGATAHDAVPMAIYCFLRYPHAYADMIRHAVFLGGDTDTIASMAGAISGAFLGRQAIPPHWINAIREDTYSPVVIAGLADQLYRAR
jgi:ADP-ribosylglycohydrolase